MNARHSLLALAALLAAGGLATPAARAASSERPAPLVSQRLDTEPIAIVGGTVHPVSSPPIENATVLLEGGRIRAIERAGAAPRGWKVIDATGRHVYPGLLAASAQGLGLTYDAQAGNADQLLSRPVSDSFDSAASEVELAASAGITTALVWATSAQSRGALQGRGALMKMSVGEPRGALLKEPAALLAGTAFLSPGPREDLARALATLRAGRSSVAGGSPPRSRPASGKAAPDALKELAARHIPLVVPFDSAGELLTAAEAAKALDIRLTVLLSTSAWEVADQLAAVKASAIQHVRPSWGTQRRDRRLALGGGWRPDAITRLTRAGVPTAACPLNDSIRVWGVGGRDLLDLPMEAAFAQRSGLSADEALASLTLVPARLFGVDDRVGSLETGKDADVIIADGDLLDYRTFVRLVIVNGRVAWDASTSRHWKNVVALKDGRLAAEGAPGSTGQGEPAWPIPEARTP